MKDKNHVDVSIDAEKAFGTIQHPLMIKPPNKLGTEAIHLNIIKAVYKEPTAGITLNDEQLGAFPLKPEQDKNAHSSHFYSALHWKSSPQQLVRNKGHPSFLYAFISRKEVVNVFL